MKPPPGKPPRYGRIDEMCERIVAANKAALLVPRVKVDAPGWMLEQDPSIKMKFDAGYTIGMSSISARPYRKAACAEVERLVRHLREKFPEANIVPIDYDPGATRVNQENRLKLMLSVARESLSGTPKVS